MEICCIEIVERDTGRVSKDTNTLLLKTTLKLIYQTRETVFHQDIQTARRELRKRRAGEYF